VPLFNALVWGGGANPFIGIGKYGLQKLETFLYGMVQSAFRYLEPLTRDSGSALPPTFNGNFFVQEYFCVKIFHENPITLSGDMSQIVEIAISRNGTKISYSEYNIWSNIRRRRRPTQGVFGSSLPLPATSALNKQVAQLSQRNRAARWVSFGEKWKTGTRRQYFADIVGLSSTNVT